MATLNSSEPALLRVSEVARIIGFGRSKTYEMIRAGEIPSLDIDGNIRVPMTSLQAWLEHKISSAANPKLPVPRPLQPHAGASEASLTASRRKSQQKT